MRLRTELLLLSSAFVIVLALAGGVLGWLSQERTDAQGRLATLQLAAERSARLGQAYADEESGQRGFVLSGQDALLGPYTDGTAAVTRVLPQLIDAAGSQPALMSAVDAVRQAGGQWQTQAAEPAIAARRRGDAAAANTIVENTAGLFQTVRDRLTDLRNAVNGAVTDQEHHQADLNRQTAWAIGLAVGALAVVGAVAAMVIQRRVVRPLRQITVGAEAVASGLVDHVVPSPGPPEVARIGDAVERMRRTLRAEADRAERAHDALGQEAAIVVNLQAELAGELGQFPTGWSVAAALLPAEGLVAGDCYDAFLLSPTHVAAVVIDIAGHGAEVAVAALRCKEILHTALRAGRQPGYALTTLHEQLPDELIVTAVAATIDTRTGAAQFANAGHPPVAVWRPSGVELLEPTGPLLGPLPGSSWSTGTTTIDVDDFLVLYTDGLTEARAADGAFYGEARLLEVLQSIEPPADADTVVRRVMDDLTTYTNGHVRDDTTLVCVARG